MLCQIKYLIATVHVGMQTAKPTDLIHFFVFILTFGLLANLGSKFQLDLQF